MADKRISNFAWFVRAGALALVAALTAGAAGLWLLRENGVIADRRSVCADFTDAIGVYPGNTVSLMGVSVGVVSEITPRPDGVRMTLDVDTDVTLPADVGVVTIDNSIVTDRRVEFTTPYTSGPTLEGDSCIPVERTKTPRGVSDSFTAASELLTGVLGSDDADNPGVIPTEEIAELVDGADATFSDRGEQLNELMRSFVLLQGDATETDAIMRRMLENSDLLVTEANAQWPDVEGTLKTINDSATAFSAFSEEFAPTLDSATVFAPILGRFLPEYGERIIAIIKYIGPWVNTLVPYFTNIAQIVAALPGLATVTDQIFDQETGALRIMWKPPAVDLSQSDVAGVCAALGRPEGCIVDSSSVGLVQLLLGSGTQ